MKKSIRLLSIILTLCMMISAMSFQVLAAEEYSILDTTYVRVIGRTEVTADGRSINWSQAGIEFKFTGKIGRAHV